VKVLVYGLGRSGLAAARLALSQGHEVQFHEQRADGPDISEALQLGARRIAQVSQAEADVCIAAPGVRIDHADLTALRQRGMEVIGEVEWVWRTVPDAGYVGVSGTAGKGTVTSWITHTLALAGIDALAGGNLDPALAAVARNGATHVVELSSFQLERCPTFAPRVAVLLNLGVDHLDRHGTVSAYHAAKHALLANLTEGSLLVYNGDDPKLRSWAAATPARAVAFSLTPQDEEGAAGAWLDSDGWLQLDSRRLLPAADLGVPGRHNIANALAAALTCRELGVPPDVIARGLASFPGLPGRYSQVAQLQGVTFIEDSIATRPLAVRAALEATPGPVVWLAGGHDKGADIGQFTDLLPGKVVLFIGFGAAGADFCRELEPFVPTIHCSEADGRKALRSALRQATAHLRSNAPFRGTVLLAPLAASFDQFRDYQERAEIFRSEVRRLVLSWTGS
jgi:UDP-N-acetylmuramoylalanine--D-glutamate ligase